MRFSDIHELREDENQIDSRTNKFRKNIIAALKVMK